MIEFLCPNNHKIRCSDDREGHEAKCPKCGVKFLIPSNGSSDKSAVHQEAASAQVPGLADSHISLDALDKISAEESSAAVFKNPKSSTAIKTSAATAARLQAGSTANAPSMARLFAQLWAEKPKDAILEIILRNGEVYKPDLYSKKLSLQNQGVFAVKEMDGTYTIIIVSWDALSHVQIRKMHNLPAEFD
ncbi:MAG: hypothetical protein ABSE63_13085 [Thermoguttaceae bacterium]